MSSSFFVNTGGSAAERETISNDLTASANSKADAQKLAINAEDAQFTLSDGTTTGNSALHHAAKAEASATSATGSASTATQQAGIATQAKTDAQAATATALIYRDAAVAANNNSVLLTGAQAIAGAKTFSNAMTVNDTITADGVTVGTGDVITVGEYANSTDGTSQNLRFYINANGNAYIDHGHDTGGLIVLGRNFNVKNDASEMLIQTTDTTTSLYHNSSANPKLDTTSSGIDVTGTVTADGFTVGSGNNELTITTSNNDTFFKQTTTTGNVFLDANNFVVRDGADQSYRINCGDSDGVVLYGSGSANRVETGSHTEGVLFKTGADGAEATRAEITNSGLNVTGTVTADSLDLSGNTTGSNSSPLEALKLPTNSKINFNDTFSIAHRTYSDPYAYISEVGSGGLRIEGATVSIFTNDGSADGAAFDVQRINASAGATGNVKLYYGDETNFANHKFETTSTGVNVVGTVTADGLKIGPDALDIQLNPASTNSNVNQVYLRGNASNDKSTVTLNHYGVRAFDISAGVIGSGLFHIGNGASDPALVIDGSSNVLVGTQSTPSATNAGFMFTSDQLFTATTATSLNYQVRFYNGNGLVGAVTTNGSATAFLTSSDYRLKTDAQPMTGATDRLKQLNPVNFQWIADGTRVDGFLAHEAQAIVPESVTGTKDAMKDEEYEVTPAVLDADDNVVTEAVMGTRSVPDYQGIDQAKLVPLLVATIQELEARITALEA